MTNKLQITIFKYSNKIWNLFGFCSLKYCPEGIPLEEFNF